MWYSAKVKGGGAKPLTAHAYIEANSESEAKEIASEFCKSRNSLFGVSFVEVHKLEGCDVGDIENKVSGVGGYNVARLSDGTVIQRKDGKAVREESE